MKSVMFPCSIGPEPAELWAERVDGAPPRLLAKRRHDVAGSREVVNRLAEAAFLLNDSQRYVDVNAAALRMTGYPIEILLSLASEDIIAPDFRQDAKLRWAILRHCRSLNGRSAVRTRAGAILPVIYQAWAHVLPGYYLVLKHLL